jgi:hypothetical protein
MARPRVDYICTHDLTIKGKVVKAGDVVDGSKLSKETIKQYVAGGILREATPAQETPSEE